MSIQRAQGKAANTFDIKIENKAGTSEAGIKQNRKRRMRSFDQSTPIRK